MNETNSENSVYRILDASINRTGEGLRVVEDYLRMVLADKHLASQIKRLRHELTSATSGLDQEQLIAARDSERDVGRNSKTNAEYERESATRMVQANFGRAQQGLRTIEEFSKTISTEISQKVEQVRYDAYTIEKAVLTTMLSLSHLGKANLCVLIDRGPEQNLQYLFKMAEQLTAVGVGLLQLRDKSMTDRELVEAGKKLTGLTRDSETRWIMNDRADLAHASGAAGVHLGQDDLSVTDARKILGAAKIIGVSTHSIEQARQAVIDGANYIGVGPVFQSQTKQFDSFVGLELVRAVAEEIQLPAFAIGGIDHENVHQVIENGLNRAAVHGAVTNASDPVESAKSLGKVLRKSE